MIRTLIRIALLTAKSTERERSEYFFIRKNSVVEILKLLMQENVGGIKFKNIKSQISEH